MNHQERTSFHRFVFRHANLTPIDYALGHDIFDKVLEERLNAHEKNYFLGLAETEEAELVEAHKEAPSEATVQKIERLLQNAREVKELLKRKTP
ncbi:MAG: hypothetical protein WAO55_07750 [Candidatus Manganitrophaceae bacterium]